MKKLFTATSLLAALAAAPAFAQTTVVRANVPFEFHAGGAVLPAGEYEFTDGLNRETIRIRSTDGKHTAFVIAQARNTATTRAIEPVIAFRNVDGKAYLATVSRPAATQTVHTPRGEGYKVIAASTPSPAN